MNEKKSYIDFLEQSEIKPFLDNILESDKSNIDFKDYIKRKTILDKYYLPSSDDGNKSNRRVSFFIYGEDEQTSKSLLERLQNWQYDLLDIRSSLAQISETINYTDSEERGNYNSSEEEIIELLEKIPDYKWKNPNLKWLNPCNGLGNITYYIIAKLFKNLTCIPNESERYNHIINNMIHVSDISTKNVSVFLSIIDPFRKYTPNVYLGDSNDIIEHSKCVWGIHRFDVIVMNPPISRTKHINLTINMLSITQSLLCYLPYGFNILSDSLGLRKKFLQNGLVSIDKSKFDITKIGDFDKISKNKKIANGRAIFFSDNMYGKVSEVILNGEKLNLSEIHRLPNDSDKMGLSIMKKVISSYKKKSTYNNIFNVNIKNDLFGIPTNINTSKYKSYLYELSDDSKRLFGTPRKNPNDSNEYYDCLIKKGELLAIKKDKVDKRKEIGKYKICFPAINSRYKDFQLPYNKTRILLPNEVCSNTYISFMLNFDLPNGMTEEESIEIYDNFFNMDLILYIIAQTKQSQHLMPYCFEFIPPLCDAKGLKLLRNMTEYDLSNYIGLSEGEYNYIKEKMKLIK